MGRTRFAPLAAYVPSSHAYSLRHPFLNCLTAPMSNPTKIGGQEPSEPPSAEPPSAETAEEENPAIAAFNSWGGEGSPPPPGFAHAPPAAGMPARRRTIGRTGSIARQAQSPPPVRARRPGQPPIDAIRTRVPPAQAAPRPAADFLGPRLGHNFGRLPPPITELFFSLIFLRLWLEIFRK